MAQNDPQDSPQEIPPDTDRDTERVLITGAAGNMGRMLRTRLAKPGRILRLLDRTEPPPGEGVETVQASVTDGDALLAACDGVSAVIHLGGISLEAPFEEILDVNVRGTQRLLEAVHRSGVPRVVLASSNHAVGFTDRADAPVGGLPADLAPRPDSFYGWSKAATEALGRLYVDTYGIDVFCVRIGTCFAEPFETRALASWMSPDDAGRLFEACLTTRNGGFRMFWGISDNTRRWWSLDEGFTEVGYRPQDDAEPFADALLAKYGPVDPADPVHRLVGGRFCAAPLGEWM